MKHSISVLIANYHWDVRPLVETLHQQLIETGLPFEILCADNYQSEEYNDKLSRLNELSNVQYIVDTVHMGRSQNRNALARRAKYEYLLFIDGDARISDTKFVQRYTERMEKNITLCGGTKYGDKPRDMNYYLRWIVGKAREEISAEQRNVHPYHSFSTFNFLVPKAVFEVLSFNEDLTQYGHEDTLFGLQLEQKGFLVKHIDNPLEHLGLDTNKDFLEKTRKGIENLKYLIDRKAIVNEVRIARWYQAMRRAGMQRLASAIFLQNRMRWEKHLMGKYPRTRVYDFYKLGYLCSLK